MKAQKKMLLATALFYLALFVLQLGFYFWAPSFYVSSPDQLSIPKFIIFTFAKYFGLIFALYLLWGGLLGLTNALLLKLNKPRWHYVSQTKSFLALIGAQFLGTLLYLSFFYPAIFHYYPGLKSLPLGLSYALIFGLMLWALSYFLRQRTQVLSRGIPQVTLSLALPLLLCHFLLKPTPLHLPQATAAASPHLFLLGVDALNGDSGNALLKRELQKLSGSKNGPNGALIFQNAFTPLPLTHPAWNSILSGLYPKHHGVRYFFDSPLKSKHPELFLPKLLKAQGYHTVFASDQPETSYFAKEEDFDHSVMETIGWEAHMVAMILNHFVYPALWLNNGVVNDWFPGYFNHASLFNYDINRFITQSFASLPQKSNAPHFMALHTCYLHSPIRLTRAELARLPQYWKLAPEDFNFQKWPNPGEPQMETPADWINPYFIREQTVLNFTTNLLQELSDKQYFQHSTVAFLSDHGERFVKDREIYGGVHGVDLKTREQNNVVFALVDPKINFFKVERRLVSLIDVAPTLLSRIGALKNHQAFDGQALLGRRGQALTIAKRPILAESMGYIDDAEEKVKFPQISVKTLEESLTYGRDGSVTIGEDYYARVLKKKTFADFAKQRELWDTIRGER